MMTFSMEQLNHHVLSLVCLQRYCKATGTGTGDGTGDGMGLGMGIER